MYCTQCGSQNPDDARFCFHCGAQLPEPGSMPAAPPPPPPVVAAPAPVVPEIIYAGFWRRFLAMLIDGLILGIPSAVIAMVFVVPSLTALVSASSSVDEDMIVSILLPLLFSWIWLAAALMFMRLFYWTLFESSRFQATPGKLALGIVVTDLQGQRITFARSLGRNLGKVLSHAIFNIGFLMAGLTQKKQALHDMLADCLVVMK